MKNEPVAIGVLVVSVLKSLLLLGTSMEWWDLTQQQQDAWLGFAAALNLLVDAGVVYFIRRQVTPVAKFPSERVRRAINRGKHHKVKVKDPAPINRPPIDPLG
jgi:hypothetical protein